jgi:hypothetical protein
VGLYNFQERFVPFIESGEKTHTIRAGRKYPAKVGDTLHLYTGLRRRGPIIQKLASGDVVRQKMARLLMRAPCTRVEEIRMVVDRNGCAQVFIDGEHLALDEREALAKRDGFKNWQDMADFWNGRYPFEGHIIHWKFDAEVKHG